MRQRLILVAKIAAAVLLAGIAIHVLARDFSSISLAELGESLGRIGWDKVSFGLAATLATFAAVATYDAFALRYAGKRLLFRKSALSSTTSYAISNLLGFPVFTGNAVRFWLFEDWGFGAAEVAICAIVTTIVCNLMLVFIAGASLITTPELLNAAANLSPTWGSALGFVLLAAATALTVFAVAGPKRLRIWRFEFNRPGPLLIPNLLACAVDYVATAAVLYVLLGDSIAIDFLPFVALFSIAKLIGIVSNVPGGLGVFEAVMASTVGNVAPATLAAALIAYRCIFYLAPFGIAAGAVAVHALARASRRTTPRQPSTPSG
jgi:uncharacterized membrane protein YbhN (UPF0104 family)